MVIRGRLTEYFKTKTKTKTKTKGNLPPPDPSSIPHPPPLGIFALRRKEIEETDAMRGLELAGEK